MAERREKEGERKKLFLLLLTLSLSSFFCFFHHCLLKQGFFFFHFILYFRDRGREGGRGKNCLFCVAFSCILSFPFLSILARVWFQLLWGRRGRKKKSDMNVMRRLKSIASGRSSVSDPVIFCAFTSLIC